MRLVELIQEAQAELQKYKRRNLNHRAIYRYEEVAECLERAHQELAQAEAAATGLWHHAPKSGGEV